MPLISVTKTKSFITPTTAYKWPDAKLSPETSLQLFFALVCLGNVYFAAILATLFCLYHFGITNPWCSGPNVIKLFCP